MHCKGWTQTRLPMIEGGQVPEYFHSHVCQLQKLGSCVRLTFGTETTLDGHLVLEPVVRLAGPWDLFVENRLQITEWMVRAEQRGEQMEAVGLH